MIHRRLLLRFVLCFPLCFVAGQQTSQAEEINADICVYGGTASGVCAALAAARRGNSVIIVAPFRHPGGMHGGGIRLKQDCLYLRDIGGIARELHDEDAAMPGNGSCNQWQARLMSGEYSHRAKVWHTFAGGNHLRASEMTMAEAFKASRCRITVTNTAIMYRLRPRPRTSDANTGAE